MSSVFAGMSALPGYIQIKDVRKVYGEGPDAVEAVAGTSFTVERGQFVAILGPSGCGKSTLLMMCAGLEPLTSGSIKVAGSDMVGARREFGVMFQDASLLPWKTVYDNIMFPIKVFGRRRQDYAERAETLMTLAKLSDFRNKRPHELSGGMRQRAAICRTLIHDPEILLMDEPFSALDAITRDEMNEALLDIWQRYTKTALFVTHSIHEALLLADRVLVMTRRPATVVADITVPFGRPRSLDIDRSPEFTELAGHIRDLIGHR